MTNPCLSLPDPLPELHKINIIIAVHHNVIGPNPNGPLYPNCVWFSLLINVEIYYLEVEAR